MNDATLTSVSSSCLRSETANSGGRVCQNGRQNLSLGVTETHFLNEQTNPRNRAATAHRSLAQAVTLPATQRRSKLTDMARKSSFLRETFNIHVNTSAQLKLENIEHVDNSTGNGYFCMYTDKSSWNWTVIWSNSNKLKVCISPPIAAEVAQTVSINQFPSRASILSI